MTDAIGSNSFETIPSAEADENGLFERPVLPLRGMVIYPKVVAPVAIPEGRALNAARFALGAHQTVIGVAMKDPTADVMEPDNLYLHGTEIALGRMISLPDGYKSALAEGRRRVEIVEVIQTDPYIIVRAREVTEKINEETEIALMEQTLINMFQEIIDLDENMPEDVMNYVMSVEDPSWLADFVASTLTLNLTERQRVLEMRELDERMSYVATLLSKERDMLELKEEIDEHVQDEIARNQREIYLREQMRVIQTELGEGDIFQQEIIEIRDQIFKANLPQEAQEKALRELSRLQILSPMAPEMGIIRNYLDWLVALPWNQKSVDNLDVKQAQEILDEEHHGLPKIKDRILEHIAVRKLAAAKMKSPILCFVGPPGVGKTSLGKSIAKALGREFVRVSLGGVRDEAEIRGHRRTYVGAMPGRIIQTMRRAGTTNPVFMMDEIDKLGNDFRGDPAAALLEALDPEQNKEYSDHYLEVPFDLSQVLFITTANDLYPIPPALMDRMEIIEFPGYTEDEKLEIARAFLIPQQIESHGIDQQGLKFETFALQTMIREYTYEAGVRNLNREIGTICRKVARLIAEEKPFPKKITSKKVNDFLGPPEFLEMRANDKDSIGIATGLAWTANGGDVLTIEASLLPGKGILTLTGQLGEVMQESAQTALSYMRSRAKEFDVAHEDFENYDIHIHLPEGAIPKDGPSAGITLASAIISIFTEREIRANFAMTGEITLRGRVLPIGGMKEKVLAAHRAQIKNVILPAQNRKDLVDIPPKTLRGMNLVFVEDMQQVIDAVLLEPPLEGRQRDLEADQDIEDDREDDFISEKSNDEDGMSQTFNTQPLNV